MNNIFSTIQYCLVYHPDIVNFKWITGKTIGSSPFFLTANVLLYLFLTFILSQLPLPSIPPRVLRSVHAVHNLFLLVFSFIMAMGGLVSAVSIAPSLKWLICFPLQTPAEGPLFFWAYVFYLSKIVEFIDTLLIILSNSMKRLTFLHVYHHATVVIMCYLGLETSQTLFPAVLITNASVHVLMYIYYLGCAVGIRPKWKRIVTEFQILQFCSSFVVLGLMMYYHNTGPGCSGAWSWCFNGVFYGSLLALFVDFHSKNYGDVLKMPVDGVKQT